MIQYEGNVYRPPSEAFSLLIQATVGCSYNRCAFCALYKDDRFRIRDTREILSELQWAREHYGYIEKIFLCDGDALCLSMDRLMEILTCCRALFPECRSVNVYGNARDVLAKGPDDLRTLAENGVKIIYLGAESGSDEVLKRVNKGSTAAEMEKAIRMIEDAGIKASVTLISGLGGKELMEEHAVKSAELISRSAPSFFSFLTLILTPQMELFKEKSEGRFVQLNAREVAEETKLFFEKLELPDKIESGSEPGQYRKIRSVFRSNHVSNALSLRGELPGDREKIINDIDRFLSGRAR